MEANTRILGIESSCDETAAAVVVDGREILSSIVASQLDVHRKYGGVVPELASREHLRQIVPVVREALGQARLKLQEVDAIGVTQGPGLVGALLVGITYGKTLAQSLGKPLVPVNHLEGHVHAVFLEAHKARRIPKLPAVCLIVSGGHTVLYEVHAGDPGAPVAGAPFRYRKLGQTRDDAAGEAYDKVAKRFASEKKPWRAANENSTSCSRFAAKPRLGLCGNFKMRWFAIWWTAPWPPQRNSGLRRFWCLAAWPPTASCARHSRNARGLSVSRCSFPAERSLRITPP